MTYGPNTRSEQISHREKPGDRNRQIPAVTKLIKAMGNMNFQAKFIN